jgi:hypothetical protein
LALAARQPAAGSDDENAAGLKVLRSNPAFSTKRVTGLLQLNEAKPSFCCWVCNRLQLTRMGCMPIRQKFPAALPPGNRGGRPAGPCRLGPVCEEPLSREGSGEGTRANRNRGGRLSLLGPVRVLGWRGSGSYGSRFGMLESMGQRPAAQCAQGIPRSALYASLNGRGGAIPDGHHRMVGGVRLVRGGRR